LKIAKKAIFSDTGTKFYLKYWYLYA